MRCMHESQLYPDNSFITLTYDDANLPPDYSIHLRDWQLFMKRLREAVAPRKLRFYACGEYGDTTLRPHYHALIFNYDFPQKTVWNIQNKKYHYTSPLLTNLWSKGLATTSDVTYQSAAYVARYVMKKLTGDNDKVAEYYTRIHPITRTVHTVHPEFAVMSRRPGIGRAWLDKFKSDCYPSDFLIVDGKKHSVPKYYDAQLTEEELLIYKRLRKRKALPRKPDQTPARLRVRATVRDSRISQLKRPL